MSSAPPLHFRRYWWALLLLVVIFAAASTQLTARARVNMAGLSLLGGQPGDLLHLDAGSAPDCQTTWLALMARRSAGGEPASQDWRRAMQCNPAHAGLAHALHPQRLDLAQIAVQAQPASAEGWFWLAELSGQDDPQTAVEAYVQGLRLRPEDVDAWRALSLVLTGLPVDDALALFERTGLKAMADAAGPTQADARFILAAIWAKSAPQQAVALYRQTLAQRPLDSQRWRDLGDLLLESDPNGALQAYLQSCKTGDFGYNGCYRAGMTAERLGDISAAITYYRLSKWPPAQQRADELQAGQTAPQP